MKVITNRQEVIKLINLIKHFIQKYNNATYTNGFLCHLLENNKITQKELDNIERLYVETDAVYEGSNLIYMNIINQLYNKHIKNEH